MYYKAVPELGASMSRLVLGTYGLTDFDTAAPVLDAYLAAGGNCADTAYLYSGGQSERVLGQWVEDRAVRSEFLIIGKGAHTPECFPDRIGPQLDVSLDRLRTDFLDIYMLHRDNPDVPVGEFMGALAEEHARGRIRAIGVSNWTLDRVDEANAWAAEHRLPPVIGVSNHLSLAEMVGPPWPGCVASSDRESRRRLQESGLALFPWSTLAHGFFAPGGVESAQQEGSPLEAWWGPENLERIARATKMGEQRGVAPATIALAFVLAQPFTTFPLIGPLTVGELTDSLRSLEVELTAAEAAWLADGGDDPNS